MSILSILRRQMRCHFVRTLLTIILFCALRQSSRTMKSKKDPFQKCPTLSTILVLLLLIMFPPVGTELLKLCYVAMAAMDRPWTCGVWGVFWPSYLDVPLCSLALIMWTNSLAFTKCLGIHPNPSGRVLARSARKNIWRLWETALVYHGHIYTLTRLSKR